jgi:hypothetical protein
MDGSIARGFPERWVGRALGTRGARERGHTERAWLVARGIRGGTHGT